MTADRMHSTPDDLSLTSRFIVVVALLWFGGVLHALVRVDGWTVIAGAVLGVALLVHARQGYRQSTLPALYGSPASKSQVEPFFRGVGIAIPLFGPGARWLLEEFIELQAEPGRITQASVASAALFGLVFGAHLWIERGLAQDRRNASERAA